MQRPAVAANVECRAIHQRAKFGEIEIAAADDARCHRSGPTLRVRQGSQIVVHVTNDTDLETTVHWHGLRLENRYDGVPGEKSTLTWPKSKGSAVS